MGGSSGDADPCSVVLVPRRRCYGQNDRGAHLPSQTWSATENPTTSAALKKLGDVKALLGAANYRVQEDLKASYACVRQREKILGDDNMGEGGAREVAFHFRAGGQNYGARMQMLGQMAQSLTELAARHRVAAVLMNQVTTRVNDATGSAQVVPALGDSVGRRLQTSAAMLEWRLEPYHDYGAACPTESTPLPSRSSPRDILRAGGSAAAEDTMPVLLAGPLKPRRLCLGLIAAHQLAHAVEHAELTRARPHRSVRRS